ncbi:MULTISPECIES: 16S rRNA (uracil(1498)-N(3))-methyltransferase [Chloracidobacterium]|uniref:Ribosomal RNA small subunit methyltransferase E n=1 Tax=Chloracidobacterium thermophilum (strain B) TaxID=981222 RepID=G2LDH4_CHLTF|nr:MULTISPECIES: 16S rRNA (uracil(1498)-N(3))-methyltransferase [Chloracidobacterium]AEP12434.1 RNA methyltransferase, RsmE family [Chloracidobacterium thermophilum B]QUV78188.1 16S rRNA (uracil(1498)-N(3))-methyltransferase [Chloracidobacterium thermophilum]QUV81231.1 16S rRNA (uracil(1498)-N(3))-methyltransferase [Chloracidobacterium sp. D]
MPGHRFYAPSENFTATSVQLAEDEAHHAVHVLRIRVGEVVTVFDGQGQVFQATVTEASKRGVRLALDAPLPALGESPLDLTLGVALLKADKFEWVIQKAVELGVTRIVPLVTRHVEPGLIRGASEKLERWSRISREATKQCGRGYLTPILPPQPVTDVLLSGGVKFFFTERQGNGWAAVVSRFPGHLPTVVALVGPEGGWSEDERQLAEAQGAHGITLGPRILRAETAAILAVGLLQTTFGDVAGQPL